MAEKKMEAFEHYVTCPMCLETFRDPVSLSCNHNFCLHCLKEFWKEKENRTCPVCRRKLSKDVVVNFSLKQLADSFAGREEGGSSETDKGEKKVEVVCSKHPEEPKLFCKDENKVLCSVCDGSVHDTLTVVPVEEAVTEMKDELKSDLKTLQEKKNKYKETQKTYDEIMKHVRKQVSVTESQIRAEFKKLHQFLKEEEESRLAALREEEEQKRMSVMKEMKRIEEQMSSLSDSICAVEQELRKASAPFLAGRTDTRTLRAQWSASEPQLISGTLIHVDQHLGNLSFRVWDKMKDKVQLSPVILDPNTAYGRLHLSDDLTGVRRGDTVFHHLPDNPERFTEYANVQGSEGFTSGRHRWDVEVGDHPKWNIGLVKESANRKGERFASPEYGMWCLKHRRGKYNNSLGRTVTVKTSPRRIRVELDYDRGEVSFYDAEDKTHICTHKDTFTEKLYPYFYIGEAGDAKTAEIRICQSSFSVVQGEMKM